MTDIESWRIEVRSGARLHFGLVMAAGTDELAYGGVGLMVQRPQAVVEAASAGSDCSGETVCGRFRLVCRHETERTRACNVLRVLTETLLQGDSREALCSSTIEPPRNSGAVTGDRDRTPVPRVVIQVRQSIPGHVGFGSGTQNSLAVGLAALLADARAAGDAAAWEGLTAAAGQLEGVSSERGATYREPRLGPTWRLARLLGRSRRSAVGTIGFAVGGLIAEGAVLPHGVGVHRTEGAAVSGGPEGENHALASGAIEPRRFVRVVFPESWRFLIVWRHGGRGMAGRQEEHVFRRLPPMGAGVLERLRRVASETLIPAAATGDFRSFCEALAEYGLAVGRHFSAFQGGTLADAQLERALRHTLSAGTVWAQSSWGPAVCIPCDSEGAAEALQREIVHRLAPLPYRTVIAAPRNRGAEIVVVPSGRHTGVPVAGAVRTSGG